ncbi:ESX secretion-associated protein EspG [Saccharopolyspora sp. 5N708]|uniref:ESX secretion-associated protein EspG n=1 Tax=Saccharopolyspora sp. 5N708 TaxID=3457424 RepID=UPI003FD06B1C
MGSADFLLSTREYDVLWSDLGCGPAPYPLAVASHGATEAERAEIRADEHRALSRRGLFGKSAGAELESLLRLLASPRFLIDSAGFTDQPMRAVAAGNGRSAVLAELSERGLALTSIRPTALAGELVGLLPDAEPGRGRSIAIRHSDLRRATDEDEDDPLGPFDERDALLRAGVPVEDANRLLQLAENRTCGGQFGVSVAAERSSVLVTWFDSEGGRYLMVRDGDWLSIAPADRGKITQRLDEVLAAHTR